MANFSGTPTSGTAPLNVTFTDASSNSPTSWSWTFGDSNSATAQNPSHTYSSAGTYTVALTATNVQGNNTCTKANYITASTGSAPVANFSGNPTSGLAPLSVTFTDSSTNTPTAWSWNFGDSNTSTVQNPSHTYSAAGNYTVALTATNAYGNNTNTKTNYISALAAFYPTTCTLAGSAVSGSDSDLTTSNDVYRVYNCDPGTNKAAAGALLLHDRVHPQSGEQAEVGVRTALQSRRHPQLLGGCAHGGPHRVDHRDLLLPTRHLRHPDELGNDQPLQRPGV